MIISATEFKVNFGKYLDLAKQHEILITKNGKAIAKISSATAGKYSALDGLVGILGDEDDASSPDLQNGEVKHASTD